MTDAPGALDGIRIPDFTQLMLKPLCTQTLADLGTGSRMTKRGIPGQGLLNRPLQTAGRGPGSDRDRYLARNCG